MLEVVSCFSLLLILVPGMCRCLKNCSCKIYIVIISSFDPSADSDAGSSSGSETDIKVASPTKVIKVS